MSCWRPWTGVATVSSGWSQNGWPCNSSGAAIDVQSDWSVNGVTAPGGMKGGDVDTVFTYLFNALDTRVEEAVPGWNWGWEYRENVNDPSSMSNHASATALDYNAPYHPNGASQYEGWSSSEVAEIRKILAELDNQIRWGADYSGTKDSMHFEVNCDAATLAGVADKVRNMEDDMGLSADDKEWIEDAIANGLNKALNVDKNIVTNDRASTPNDIPYSFQTGVERLIRLTSGTFVGESGKPHDD
jgi:hypothetical protein